MKIRIRFAVACLFLISFASCHAVACVTADTDLSDGGFETSAAADPCSVVRPSHGPLLSSGQGAGINFILSHKYLPTGVSWASYSDRGILANLILLLTGNWVAIASIYQDPLGMGLDPSVAGANV